MTKTINLRKFCREYPGALQKVFPPEAMGAFLKAEESGITTPHQTKKLIYAWIELIDSVGIDSSGSPYVIFKENLEKLVTGLFHA